MAITNKLSLTGRALSELRQGIITGVFAPGSRLNIEWLKQELGMGATPIREALNQLSAYGLVEALPLKGFRVAPISKAALEDLYNNRMLIESEGLRRASQFGDEHWESQVIAAHHRLLRLEAQPEKLQINEWMQRYREFHLSLFSACRSPVLRQLILWLFEQSERYRYIRFSTVENPAETLKEKREDADALVKAIMDREQELAVELLQVVLQKTVHTTLEHWL